MDVDMTSESLLSTIGFPLHQETKHALWLFNFGISDKNFTTVSALAEEKILIDFRGGCDQLLLRVTKG